MIDNPGGETGLGESDDFPSPISRFIHLLETLELTVFPFLSLGSIDTMPELIDRS